MARPRIGFTSSSGQGITMAIETVGRGYLDPVAAAGGLPVIVPTLEPGLAAEAVAGLDGLVLTGGGDVEPARFGAVAQPESGPPDLARDAWELALVAASRAAGLPILAICRGIQVLNVAYGGTLVQHLGPGSGADAGEGHDHLARADGEVHGVAVAPGSRLRSIVGAERIGVNSLHHQAVDVVGSGLVVSGCADDGVIEAVEAPAELVLGVQWHPELLADRAPHRALFGWIVGSAASR